MSPPAPSTQESTETSTTKLNQILVAAVLEHAPFRIYFKDRESRFIAVSRQKFLRHSCSRAEEMTGKTDVDYTTPEHAQRSRAIEEQIMRTGEKMVDQAEKSIGPNGEIQWGRSYRLPLRDELGTIIGTFGYTEDISKETELSMSLRDVQGALVDAARMAGMAEVATGVLHNVGNVLNSLNVSSSIIAAGLRQSKAESLKKVGQLLREHAAELGSFLTEDQKGKKVPEFLDSLSRHFSTERERLLKEVEGMLKNVDHIKEIVSMQQAYASMGGLLEPIEAATMMEDALRMNSGLLGRNQIQLIKDYQPVPTIMAEKGKVLQILVNLIRNSKHACDESGRPDKTLVLRVSRGEPGRVCLIVQDNGIGIPEENLLKIFQHGFTTKTDGHGFGIHSSANAAREMKGSLSVQSEGSGKGATFILDLPETEIRRQPVSSLSL